MRRPLPDPIRLPPSAMLVLRAVGFALSVLVVGCGSTDGADLDQGSPSADAGDGAADEGTIGSCGPSGECPFGERGTCGGGEACLLVGSTADGWMTVCRPEGAGVEGTACSPGGANQCADGFVCSAREGECRAYCCGSEDCPEGQFCLGLAGAEGAGQCRTIDDCRLVPPQTGCEEGQGCYALDAGPVCLDEGDVPACLAGDVSACDECAFANSCEGGAVCVLATRSVCRRMCDVDAAPGQPGACPPRFTCQNLPDIDDVGFCQPN
ncbi:MAG: hypothetical protein ACFCGT_19880 [Sandaracinaceae bacterium]